MRQNVKYAHIGTARQNWLGKYVSSLCLGWLEWFLELWKIVIGICDFFKAMLLFIISFWLPLEMSSLK